MIKVTLTYKLFGGESTGYKIVEEEFESKEQYDIWLKEQSQNELTRKIVGIYKEEII